LLYLDQVAVVNELVLNWPIWLNKGEIKFKKLKNVTNLLNIYVNSNLLWLKLAIWLTLDRLGFKAKH
jgi:hypothetical protein